MSYRVKRRGVGRLLVLGLCLRVIASAGMAQETHEPAAGSVVPLLDGGTRPAAEVDRAVARALHQTGVLAASAAVVRADGSACVFSAGVRTGLNGLPADDRTVFRAASLSKPVFATLVFTLIDEGILELDRPLCEYLRKPLPEYPDYADLARDSRYRAITARHALSHRTGFPNWRWQTQDKRLRIFFDPGEKFLYSGEGYRYLQFVVEQITGHPLDELARARMFAPLGMTRTSFAWRDEFEGNNAVNRVLIERAFGAGFIRVPNAAGSLLTTARDYGRFLGAMLAGRHLMAATRDTMLAPRTAVIADRLFGPAAAIAPATGSEAQPFWCLGWGGFRSGAGAARFHVGFDSPEYDNYAVAYLDRGLGVVVLTSGGRGPSSASPAFVTAMLGATDTPFQWMGY